MWEQSCICNWGDADEIIVFQWDIEMFYVRLKHDMDIRKVHSLSQSAA